MRRKPNIRGNLLSNAHGSEIDWEHAAPILRLQQLGQIPFVYFVREQPEGAIKIGAATHPIRRLRELQVGNPRRLKIERLVFGDVTAERLIQTYLAEFAIGGKPRASTFKAPHAPPTEWFESTAYDRIMRAAGEILLAQRMLELRPEGHTVGELCAAIHETMQGLGYTLRRQDEARLLGRGGGYAIVKL